MERTGRNHLTWILILGVTVVALLILLRSDPAGTPNGPAPTSRGESRMPAGPLDEPPDPHPAVVAVEVLVLTASNEPAKNADLRVWSVRDRGLRYPPQVHVPHDRRRTNEEGRARVPMTPGLDGEYRFAATCGSEEGETRATVGPDRDPPVIVRLSPGAICTVCVLDECDEPAVDCRVQWRVGLLRGEPRSESRTDSAGRVVFVRRPGLTYSVRALHGETTAAIGAAVPPSASSVTLRLSDLGEVRGRVLGKKSAPLSDVRVSLIASASIPNWFRSFDAEDVTDRSGRFELPVPRSTRRITLFVETPGYQREKRTIHIKPDVPPTRDIVLKLRPSSSLTVRLTGIPEENQGDTATVRLSHMIPGGTGLTLTTNSRTCDIPDIPDGDYLVIAAMPSAGLAGSRRVKVVSTPEPGHEVELELSRAANFAGTLLGPAGEPAGGLEVRFSLDERTVAETRSDADGRFAFTNFTDALDAGSVWIRAPLARQVLWTGPASRFRAKNEEVLTLPGLHRLSGVLRWEDGGVVPGGRVAVLPALASLRSLHSYLQIRPTAQADREGRFDLWIDRSARGRVAGLAPDAIPSVVDLADVLDAGEIVLRRGRVLAGRVLSAADEPVVEAAVSLLATGRHPADLLFVVTTVTGGDGAFEFRRLDPDTHYRVQVFAPGYQAGQAVVDSIPPSPMIIRVESASGIEGVVRFADGSPCRGGRVRAIPAAGQKTGRSAGIGVEGRFRIDGLAPGAYRLRVEARPREEVGRGGVAFRSRNDVRWTSPGEPCEITVETAGYVHGVVSGVGGAPVPDAKVRVVPTGASTGSSRRRLLRDCRCRTDPAGGFRIGVPGDGGVTLEVSARGFLTQRVVAGPGSPRDVVLRAAARLTGTTLDGAGRPVGHIPLAVVASGGGPRARRVIRSDSRGQFSMDCDPAEKYSVHATDPWSSDTVKTSVPAHLEITVRRQDE